MRVIYKCDKCRKEYDDPKAAEKCEADDEIRQCISQMARKRREDEQKGELQEWARESEPFRWLVRHSFIDEARILARNAVEEYKDQMAANWEFYAPYQMDELVDLMVQTVR